MLLYRLSFALSTGKPAARDKTLIGRIWYDRSIVPFWRIADLAKQVGVGHNVKDAHPPRRINSSFSKKEGYRKEMRLHFLRES